MGTEKTETLAVKKFLTLFYQQHQNSILAITKTSKQRIEQKGKEALQNLSTLMEYTWKTSTGYTAYPTILPFSPFQENTYYFSILGEIKNNQKKDPLSTTIHEISHFIFFEYLQILKEERLNSDIIYFLKESLTAALLNTQNLRSIFNIETYDGNPEIRYIYIKKGKNNPVLIRDYIEAKRVQKETFLGFLEELIKEFKEKQREFSKKRMLWNKYGEHLKNNRKIFLRYIAPIKIK